MKRIHMIGLALMAVFAFSAVVVSSAAAKEFPEILFKLAKGEFPANFASSGKVSSLETVGGTKITCTTVANTGKIGENKGEEKEAHLGLVDIAFKGCKTKVIINVACQNKGGTKEEIKLPTIEFHLGLAHLGTNTTIPAVLLLVKEFIFECGGVEVKVTGNVIGALQTTAGKEVKAGEKLKEANLAFNQTNGKQELTTFLLSLREKESPLMAGEHLTSKTGGGAAEEAGETSTDTLKEFKNSGGILDELELVLEI